MLSAVGKRQSLDCKESLAEKHDEGAWHLFVVLEGRSVLPTAVGDVRRSSRLLGGQSRSQEPEDYRMNFTGEQCI